METYLTLSARHASNAQVFGAVLLTRCYFSLALLLLINFPHHGPFLLRVKALEVIFSDLPAIILPFSSTIFLSDKAFGFLSLINNT